MNGGPPLPLTNRDPQASVLLSIHLPAAFCSTGVTQLHCYYGSSDSWSSLLPLQVSLLTRTTLHCRSVVNHPIATLGAYPFRSHSAGFAFRSQARLAIKPNHVHLECRIRHSSLRTINSAPVAPHLSSRTRSFFQFHRTGTPAEWSSTTQGLCAS